MSEWCKHILKCSPDSHFVWMFDKTWEPLPSKVLVCPICKKKSPKWWRKIVKENA